ncbi:uncharacterized protein [Nicotiana tomentosiformis]|uniref:uncharacterized protein n=1 Tax=Nicotiana tomentosiformis TaxID=4098 RepID=UPI00388CDC76
MPYSESSWRKLSRGYWEAHSHGLPKNIELRPLVGDEDPSIDLSALGKLEATAGEKKKRKAPGSPSSEKKNLKKRLAVQQKIDRIDQLRAEMNEVQAMADVGKGKIDQLDSEEETAQEQLASVEVQLRVTKEKADKQAQLNEKLRAQMNSALAELDALGSECEAVKAQIRTASADAEEMVAQYRANGEVPETRLKTNVEYMKQLSRRETLEEIHTRGFDLSAEIEEAKMLEVKAKKLARPEDEEGSEGSNKPEGEEGPDGSGNEVGSSEDRA